jgi:hypothetical protein
MAVRAWDVIRAACPGALRPQPAQSLAATLARLAAPRLAAGEGLGAAQLRPFYLRDVAVRTLSK